MKKNLYVCIGRSEAECVDENAEFGATPLFVVRGGGELTGGGKGNIRSADDLGGNYWDFGRDNLTTGDFVLTNLGSSPYFRVATLTGAATFSSSVTSGGAITASYAGPSRMIVESTTNSNNAGIYFVTKNSSGISVQGGVYYIPSATPYLTLSGDNTNLHLNVTSSGNVGIGTTAPNSILEIAATTPVFRIQASDSASFHGIEFRQGAGFDAFIKQLPSTGEFRISNGRSVGWGGHMTFYTDTSEKIRITSAGNVGIGTTAPAYKLTVVGDVRGYKLYGGEAGVGAGNYTIFSNDDNVGYIDTVRAVNSGDFQFRFSGTSRVTISTGGNITATAFFESSDKTIKTLIEDNYQTKGIESVTAKLYLKNGVEELGYFAQDLQGILPSAVSKGADGLLNLSYREVHTAKIARLEKRVEELEAQLNLL